MLKVENLCKSYASGFKLRDVSFGLDKGYIMGFIGMNGAGKTTTLKSILNLVDSDGGTVEIFGLDNKKNEIEIKRQIGYMIGSFDYYPKTKIKKLVEVYKSFYKDWDDQVFAAYIKKFSLDENKKPSELSSGMKVKLGIALALSHNAKLLILDEPTSGLDPIARAEISDIFQSIVSDGEHSILFSTHITSDLDKCADFIIFIKNGEIIINSTKDEIIDSHLLISGKKSDLNENIKKAAIGLKETSFNFSALIKRENKTKFPDGITTQKPNLEDIMVYYNRGTEI